MNWFKRDPLLAGLICVALFSTAGEGWWVWRIRAEAIREVSVLEQKNRERDGLKTQSLTPTEENERAVDRDLDLARGKLSEMQTALGDAAGADANVSIARPTDAYFEIASFVEKIRALAGQSHVSVRPDERFGFGSYASEGP